MAVQDLTPQLLIWQELDGNDDCPVLATECRLGVLVRVGLNNGDEELEVTLHYPSTSLVKATDGTYTLTGWVGDPDAPSTPEPGD